MCHEIAVANNDTLQQDQKPSRVTLCEMVSGYKGHFVNCNTKSLTHVQNLLLYRNPIVGDKIRVAFQSPPFFHIDEKASSAFPEEQSPRIIMSGIFNPNLKIFSRARHQKLRAMSIFLPRQGPFINKPYVIVSSFHSFCSIYFTWEAKPNLSAPDNAFMSVR